MNFNDLAKLVGTVSIQFESLSAMLSGFVSSLINKDSKIGTIVCSEMSFPQNMRMFKLLMNHSFEHKRSEVEQILKSLKLSNESRNSVVHALYHNTADNPAFQKTKISAKERNGVAYKKTTLEVNELSDVIDQINATMLKLNTLHEELFGRVPKL